MQDARANRSNTIALAQKLYRASRTENGHPREAWALARRLAGYLGRAEVGLGEELAFSEVEGNRVGVSWFRNRPDCHFVMIAIEAANVPQRIWTRVRQLAQTNFVASRHGEKAKTNR